MTILVTGATGSVGRLVVDHLLAAGATDIRALSNHPDRANLPAKVQVFKGYIGRPPSIQAALEGVDEMYLAPFVDTAAEVMALAKDAGVKRVVDLAGPEGNWWYPIEVAVEASGVAWTHLDAGEFMENTTMWADQIRTTGAVRDAYPNSAVAQVAMDDVAAMAAATLLDDSHVGKALELTGPETLTRAEMVQQIGEALGRDIPYIEVTPEQAIDQLAPSMGDFAKDYVEGMALMAEHPQRAAGTIAQVLGRPATTFREWATRNADDFR